MEPAGNYYLCRKLCNYNQTVNHQDIKGNFPKMYFNKIECQIKNCLYDESQEHLLSSCITLTNLANHKNLNVNYKNIYSKSIDKQIQVTKMYSKLLEIRSEILKWKLWVPINFIFKMKFICQTLPLTHQVLYPCSELIFNFSKLLIFGIYVCSRKLESRGTRYLMWAPIVNLLETDE